MRILRPLLVGLAFLLPSPAGAAWKSEGPEHARVTAILADATQPNTAWVATQGSDVFKTIDGGANWAHVGDLSQWDVRWLQQDPNRKNTLYAGLKDEGGIWRSTDGGATWKSMRFPSTLARDPERFAFVPGSTGGIWYPGKGVANYRTNDDGATWKEFRLPNMQVGTFAFDPKNGKTVWAAGDDDATGLMKSVDGGLTWKSPAAEGLPRAMRIVQLILDPNQPTQLYLRRTDHIYWSDDDGAHFQELEHRIKAFVEGYELVLDPTPGGALYFATSQALLRRIDREPWRRFDWEGPPDDVKTIAVQPTEPDGLWVAPSGSGLYRSHDGGRSWKSSSVGLTGGWINKIWADPANEGAFLVQTKDGSYRKDGKGWHDLNDMPLGALRQLETVAFDPKNPRALCISNGAVSLNCSSDGGANWAQPLKPMTSKPTSSPRPSFAGFVQDLADSKTFYAGVSANDKPQDSIVKSIDGGVTWKYSGQGLPQNADVVLMRQQAPRTFLVLLKKLGLYRSLDGALTWTKAGAGLPAEEREIRELAVDPSNAGNVYVATKQGVLRSTDGGVSFSFSNQGLKDNTDIESVAVAPTGSRVFAASSDGIFESKNLGATWTAFSAAGLPNHDVRSLSVGAGRLYAGTAGSGVYSIELP